MPDPISVELDTFDPNDPADVIETKALAISNKLPQLATQINAATKAMNFNATNATSSTSWTIADSGSKTFDIETGKSYVEGMTVKVASRVSPQNWGLGDVSAETDGSVTVIFRDSNGSGTFSDWVISQNPEVSSRWRSRSARTSNNKITSVDLGKLIDITSGTFDQTFDPVGDLGDGFNVTIRNSGTGDVTLNPDGSETIDGRASFIMYPGEMREIFCDGTALYSVVLNPFYRRITSTYASMPIPPGYTRFGIRAWSGGASGQRTNNASTLSRGGGGGGCVEVTLAAADFGTTETVTIGAGGAAVTTVASGNVGSDTSFGSLVTAYAGNDWRHGGSAIHGLIVTDAASHKEAVYAGGATSSAVPFTGIFGGSDSSTNATQDSGNALYGGAAGGSVDGSGNIRAPGTSAFGGDGGAASISGNGTDGSQPGGGGGATQTGTQSGAGGDGQVDFWGIA